MAPGMQEECLGGLFLPPTPPQGECWALGSMEGNGLGP